MPKRKAPPQPRPQTLGWRQDFALALCRAAYGTCPFGCAKDGAPNCYHNVINLACEPSSRTVDEADKFVNSLKQIEDPKP